MSWWTILSVIGETILSEVWNGMSDEVGYCPYLAGKDSRSLCRSDDAGLPIMVGISLLQMQSLSCLISSLKLDTVHCKKDHLRCSP